MQPLVSSTIFSTLARPVTTLPSIPTSPISFMMTATGFPRSPCSSTWRRSVVFPRPRKPVRMSTATVRIRRLSGWPWRLRRTIRGLRAACSLLPPAACLQPRLVGRRCACRSRSPARSPRSPWSLGQTPDEPVAVDGEAPAELAHLVAQAGERGVVPHVLEAAADELGDRLHLGFLHPARGHRRRPEAHAAGHEGRARVVGDRVLVDRDARLVERLLGELAGELGAAQRSEERRVG